MKGLDDSLLANFRMLHNKKILLSTILNCGKPFLRGRALLLRTFHCNQAKVAHYWNSTYYFDAARLG